MSALIFSISLSSPESRHRSNYRLKVLNFTPKLSLRVCGPPGTSSAIHWFSLQMWPWSQRWSSRAQHPFKKVPFVAPFDPLCKVLSGITETWEHDNRPNIWKIFRFIYAQNNFISLLVRNFLTMRIASKAKYPRELEVSKFHIHKQWGKWTIRAGRWYFTNI